MANKTLTEPQRRLVVDCLVETAQRYEGNINSIHTNRLYGPKAKEHLIGQFRQRVQDAMELAAILIAPEPEEPT